MIIRMRPYAGAANQAAMAALVRAHPGDNVHVLDLPYRLSSWAFDDPATVGLWEDGAGRLLAWAVLQTPFWSLDYAYDPAVGDYGIHPQILTWARDRAAALAATPAGRPAWFVSVRAGQSARLGDLERAGFTRQDTLPVDPWAQVLLARPGEAPVAPAPLPPGFTIRPLAGAGEAGACAALHRAAFGSPNMTAAWRARILQRPEYIPELDLVVVAPEGRLAAYCLCWWAAQGPDGPPAGQVEPLAVHPDFQRQGLGRALLAEEFRRLQARGAVSILVETDDYRDAAFAIYEATGFRLAQRLAVWRLDVPAGA